MAPGDVRPWTDAEPPCPARARLVSLSLRPPPVTDQWMAEGPSLGPLGPATENLTLLEAPSPRLEAEAVALRLRHAVARGETAALVTPDRTLARLVAAALDRWGPPARRQRGAAPPPVAPGPPPAPGRATCGASASRARPSSRSSSTRSCTRARAGATTSGVPTRWSCACAGRGPAFPDADTLRAFGRVPGERPGLRALGRVARGAPGPPRAARRAAPRRPPRRPRGLGRGARGGLGGQEGTNPSGARPRAAPRGGRGRARAPRRRGRPHGPARPRGGPRRAPRGGRGPRPRPGPPPGPRLGHAGGARAGRGPRDPGGHERGRLARRAPPDPLAQPPPTRERRASRCPSGASARPRTTTCRRWAPARPGSRARPHGRRADHGLALGQPPRQPPRGPAKPGRPRGPGCHEGAGGRLARPCEGPVAAGGAGGGGPPPLAAPARPRAAHAALGHGRRAPPARPLLGLRRVGPAAARARPPGAGARRRHARHRAPPRPRALRARRGRPGPPGRGPRASWPAPPRCSTSTAPGPSRAGCGSRTWAAWRVRSSRPRPSAGARPCPPTWRSGARRSSRA
jgi:hypothetical protein